MTSNKEAQDRLDSIRDELNLLVDSGTAQEGYVASGTVRRFNVLVEKIYDIFPLDGSILRHKVPDVSFIEHPVRLEGSLKTIPVTEKVVLQTLFLEKINGVINTFPKSE